MMSFIYAALVLGISVLPADRLVMADRLFNRGEYAAAAKEYAALEVGEGVAEDALLYRRAECARQLGDQKLASECYRRLQSAFPDSQYARRSMLFAALAEKGEARIRLLKALDADRTDNATRAAALYHLGVETSDPAAFERSVKVDPKGKYADYSTLRRGMLLEASEDPQIRRKGVELLLSLAFGGGPLAEESLYLAAVQSYRAKRYGEAGTLFRRYRKMFASGKHADEVKMMSVWCDYLGGHYSEVELACADGQTDDFAYLRASCAYALGDKVRAAGLFRRYLDDYPQGRYRKEAELPLARSEFEQARKENDAQKTLAAAKRAAALSTDYSDRMRLAWAHENAGDADAAQREYLEIARANTNSEVAAEALYQKAMTDIRREKWSAAELALAEAKASGKLACRRGEVDYWRGIAAMRCGHEAEGTKFFESALALGLDLDQSREARLALADSKLRAGNAEAARSEYSKLVREGACERMSTSRIYEVAQIFAGKEECAICANALVASASAEWRQTGYRLLGEYEESCSRFTVAIDVYRKALAEPVQTESAAIAALSLGVLEMRAGEHSAAEKTLEMSVKLNASDVKRRARSYLALAENAALAGDRKKAVGYATVVSSLFDDAELTAAAAKILRSYSEEVEK